LFGLLSLPYAREAGNLEQSLILTTWEAEIQRIEV
jgi:hypothetical protein